MDTATPNHRNPQDPDGLKVTARIPALDAFMLRIFSELLPMIRGRHNVHLRRLGTAGIYPFQCLLKPLFLLYLVTDRISHFAPFHNFCFAHISAE
jgi:hypothetical protein